MNTIRRSSILALIAFAFVSVSAWAQTTYTWNNAAGGPWTTTTNWTPTRTTPAANDVLVFSNGATMTITAVPTQTIGQLSVSGNTNVTLNAGATATLSIAGGTGTDLSVASGSQLNVGTATALTIAVATGATGSINGSMTFAGGAHRLTAADASGITFQSGATFTTGASFSGNAFGSAGTTNSVIFANGSTFNSIAGANPFGSAGGLCQFQTGSLYSHQQTGTPSFSGRTYANFELKSAAAAFTVTGGTAVSIDNLTITQGSMTWGMTGTPGHSIKGNISVAAGATLAFAPASAGTVNLNGPSTQSITNAGTLTLNNANQTIVVNNVNGIALGSNVTMSLGTLTFTNGTITTGANTLTLNGTVTRTSGHVIGNLKKTYAATGSKTFEVGTANGYSPVVANVTAGAADLTVAATQSVQPNLTFPSTKLQRYWTLTPSAALTADLTFQYLAGDVSGNESNYQVITVVGGTPSFPAGGSVNAGTHQSTITGQSLVTADWTAGEPADTTPPAVTSVNVPANGSYGAGANLDFTVNFSENVIVSGPPFIPITLNTGGTVNASFVSGSGSSALLFRYTVVGGNNDPDGITVGSAINANGGTLRDAASNDATLTLNSVGSTTNVLVDTTAPNVLSITRANGSPTAATTVDFTVTFDEAVTGVDAADFSLTFTGITGPSITNVAGSGATRTVTVNTGSGTSGTLRLDVNNGASIQDLAGNALAAGFTSGEVYTIDKNAPSVVSVTRNNANPTNQASVSYTVTFNQSVTGVDNSDFALTTTGVTGTSITNTTGSGATYTVTVNTGSNDGTLRLDVLNNGSIQSGTSVPLSAGFTSGEVYTIDKTAPSVSSIVRADPNPTNQASVFFTVNFSESVSGVTNGDFTLTTTGVTGASITNVSGSGSTRLVQVNTGSGDGTIRLDLVTGGAIVDAAGNTLTTGFTTGEVYTIDKTAPTVSSSVRADANPTSAASVQFTVTFSEGMTAVGNSDFSLTVTGVTGASITGVTGSGSTRTVTVNTGSGDGTIRLNVITGATAQDLAGNLLASSFNSGEVYTVDKLAPAVVSINRVSSTLTNASSLSWTVTFSEAVTGVDASDFALAPTGVSSATISGVSGSGTTWTVTANSGTGDGTLGLNLVDDDTILDVDGSRPLGGPGTGNGNFTGQTYTIDKTAPTVVSINRASTDPTTASSVNFTVTFSESVTGVNTADFAIASTGLTGAAISNVSGSGTTYTVAVATGTGTGTLGLNLVDDDSIIDPATNPLGGAGAGNGNFTGQTYTVNRAPSSHLVISQVYGGGGNAGATFKNDFIEIFNPTGSTVSLSGWSVQYTGATGSTWQVTNLSGSIAPGHYYLVQEAQGAGGTVNLPTPDATGTSAMASGAGKVALVNSTTALTGTCPSGVSILDLVGYGTTANCFEGATTANLTNTTSATRIDNGCTDTDRNNLDFTVGTVNPRNSASSPWSCGGLIGNGSASPSTVPASSSTLLTVAVTPAQSPTSTGITVTADLTPIGGSATQTLFDNGTNGDITPGDNTFSFNATVGAATTSGGKTINVALADAQARAGATTISLTVLGATNPSGNGTATPASVAPTQSSLLTVTVTPGQNPTSTGITVTADLSSIGGSATQTLFDNGTNGDATSGDGTFSFNATVANATPLGIKSLPVTIQDAQARTGNTTISLTVQSASAPPAPSNLVAIGGDAQVSLSWTSSAGATGYNVKRGTASGGPYSTIATNVNTTNFLDTLVANGTHYYYIVTAVNATDESGPSNEANATPSAPQPTGSLAKIYFIDIGQGASTLIVSPTGKTLLVDGGPTGQGTQKVVPLLATLGISSIDFTILTHYHIDHDDGLTETINAGKVIGTSYDNGDTTPLAPPNAGSTKTAYQNYVNALTSHGGTITRVRPEDQGGTLAGQTIDLGGGMKATILAQGGKLLSGGSVAIDNSDLNTESISTLIEYNNFDFLVSGDLTGGGSTSTAKTPDVETYAAQLAGDIDIVEYDHHGSTTANNPRFLRILKAEAAVAECGYTNTFGHPNRETVNKYLNIPASSGNTYGGTALPNPGNGPVSYQTDPSPATDDRVSRQGYSGAAPSNAGNGTILLKTDGLTAFTMESFEDAGVRISPAVHAYSLDSAGAGVTTNFPPTVIPSITPIVPLASETVTVQAMVNDREDAISSVTLNYSLNGVAQSPVAMTLNAGLYEAQIAAQPDATRVDYTVTAVAGGKSTSASNGYFSGTTPIANLRVLDALGEPLYLDYAARIAGTATSDTNIFSVGTNDDYIQDATGGLNVWRTIQPTVPAVQNIATGSTYTVAGRIGELAGRFHLEVTPPFVSPTTPYQITQTGSGTITPATKTIAQLNANPESFEGQLISIANCTITSGTIPASGAGADGFLTITDGTGSFQLKIDKDTSIPGMATPAGSFAVIGIIQQDDFLRPFDSSYDIAPRSRVDLGGTNPSGPGLISIAAARIDVDGSGNAPGDYVPDLLNATVHVQGVVTSINFRASNGSGIEYYIQDPTAGVDIFSTATTRSLNIGDNVDVVATVKQFNGLTEFDPGATTSNLTVLAPNTLPAVSPRLVTCSQLADSGVGEPLEGQLLRINNVTLSAPPATWVASTNYTITDSSGPCTIRISASTNLPGQAPPASPFSIVGVLGQFDSAAPFDSGYQLFPRSTSDMLAAVATPASISANAGTPQTATVNTAFATQLQALVKDGSNAVISGAGVTFTAPSSGASGTFAGGSTSATAITDGSGIATAPVFTANSITGSYNVTATSGAVSTTFSLTNQPQAATHFSVSAPATVTNGTAFSVTVTALNASNGVVTGYTGTLHFTSSSAGTLPADYVFTGADNGTHTFSVTLTTNGSQTLGVTDGSITGSANLTVAPPPATHFNVSAPASVTNGTAFSVTVTALDASNATATSYTGTVHFTSSSAGTLPADYTFVSGDNGTHTFSVTLTTNGSQSVTATDTVTSSITGTTNTTVNPQPATHFSVSAPASVTNGTAFSVTVTALDASNGTVTGYTGTVHFTSSSTGTLPADYTFVAGDNGAHTFSVTLTTNGSQSVTATDTVTSSITGTTNTTVNPQPATHFSVSAPASVTNGTAFSVTVTALNASNGTVTGYTGTVHFTSSSTGTFPADYTFTAGDNGAHTFSVTLTTNGAQTVTATDTVTASINGTANVSVTCTPANATITAATSVVTGSTGNIASVANAGAGATYNWSITNGTITAGTGTNSITYTAGAVGTLTLQVTVTNASTCSDTKSANVNVTATPIPLSVTSVNPTEGKTTGGKAVTVSGTSFQNGATLTFGGAAATSVVVVNSTTITAITPAHAAGAVNVTVTNPDTTTATLTNGYTYVTTQFDANGDGVIDPSDIFFLVNYLFLGGPAPIGDTGIYSGDANGDGTVDPADIFYLVNYLYLHGPAPASRNSGISSESMLQPMTGSITLGEPVRRGGKFLVPVIVDSASAEALSLRVVFTGDANGHATIHRVTTMQPLFEISRGTSDALSYLASFDGKLSGVVAEIEVDANDVAISIDPAVTMLCNAAGTRKASVAAGTLHLHSAAIAHPQPERKE